MKLFMKYEIDSQLFDNINDSDFNTMLNCLGSKVKKYSKNEIIILTGESIPFVGIVISGELQIVKEDIFGNISLLSQIARGGLFGEAFACLGVKKSPVTVSALTDTVVLLIDFNRIVNSCSTNCSFHVHLIENMLKIMATKTIEQNFKIEILSKKGLRERVIVYLTHEMELSNSSKFEILFSRAKLAEFLCVDRSALSKELCKMRDEGLLLFHKNRFEILCEL